MSVRRRRPMLGGATTVAAPCRVEDERRPRTHSSLRRLGRVDGAHLVVVSWEQLEFIGAVAPDDLGYRSAVRRPCRSRPYRSTSALPIEARWSRTSGGPVTSIHSTSPASSPASMYSLLPRITTSMRPSVVEPPTSSRPPNPIRSTPIPWGAHTARASRGVRLRSTSSAIARQLSARSKSSGRCTGSPVGSTDDTLSIRKVRRPASVLETRYHDGPLARCPAGGRFARFPCVRGRRSRAGPGCRGSPRPGARRGSEAVGARPGSTPMVAGP